jgi:hypothetical protein
MIDLLKERFCQGSAHGQEEDAVVTASKTGDKEGV